MTLAMAMRFGPVAALGLILAGCGGGESTTESAAASGEVSLTNASRATVSEQLKVAAPKMRTTQPGEWEMRTELISYDLAGMPDGPQKQAETARMEAMKLNPRTVKRCITPEQAKKDQLFDTTALAKAAGECRFPVFQKGGGKLNARVECTGPQGDTKAQYSGTQSPTALDMTIASTVVPKGAPGAMSATMRIAGKRLGDCKG